jgi:hypothetical protein
MELSEGWISEEISAPGEFSSDETLWFQLLKCTDAYLRHFV